MRYVFGVLTLAVGGVIVAFLKTATGVLEQFDVPLARPGMIILSLILIGVGIFFCIPQKKKRKREFGISPFEEVGDGLALMRYNDQFKKKAKGMAKWIKEEDPKPAEAIPGSQ